MQPLEIIFHFGLFTDGIPLLCTLKENTEFFDDLGMAIFFGGLPAFMEDQTKWARCLEESPSQPSVVCIATLMSLHDLPALSGDNLQRSFPGVRLKAFVSFPRQDREMAARFVHTSLWGNSPDMRSWPKAESSSQYYDYAFVTSHLLRIFGRENLCVTIRGEEPDGGRRVQDAFWNFAGIAVPKESATGLRYLPPPVNMSPGHDFCEFLQQAFPLYPEPAKHISPWMRATLAFSGERLRVLPPDARRGIRERWQGSNLRLASMLGCDALFASPTQDELRAESEWREYCGLTPESALDVAGRLEPAFAKDLLARFDAIPAWELTYPQRIIHQALKKTAGIPSIEISAKTPKLSVITLTYNHAPFIRDCMDSVISQRTDFPLQHIIADDCSDDGAREIILEYAARYPHIVPVLQRERSGGPRNVRSMFEMARTEYVALCDGDDYFSDPLKLQTQVDFLDEHDNCGLCFHPVRVMHEGEPEKDHLYPPVDRMPRGLRSFYYCSDLAAVNFMQSSSAMYRWRFQKGLPDWFYDDLIQGDWYWHLLHAEKGKIGFINTVMSVYRRHPAALWASSQTDRYKHRYQKGIRELHCYDVMNKHFKGMYKKIYFDLALGVINDMLIYARKIGDSGIVDAIDEQYPEFADAYVRAAEEARGKALMTQNV